jgi:hypothetical protein
VFYCHSVAHRQQTRRPRFAIKILLMTCTAGRGATAQFAKSKLWGKQKPGSGDLEPGFFILAFAHKPSTASQRVPPSAGPMINSAKQSLAQRSREMLLRNTNHAEPYVSEAQKRWIFVQASSSMAVDVAYETRKFGP